MTFSCWRRKTSCESCDRGERLPNGVIDPTKTGNDYACSKPWRMMDPNRNRTQVVFNALGMVVGLR